MSYFLTYHNKPKYLHAVVTGECTKEYVAGYLREVVSKCAENGTKRLFIEQMLDGPRLETDDVFQIVSKLCISADGLFEAVAFVDVNAENVLNTKFAETVVVGRGIPLKVFFHVKDAEDWLNGKL